MTLELEELFGMVDVDDGVKCITVAGRGRIFCAGIDLEPEFVGARNQLMNIGMGECIRSFNKIQANNPFLASIVTPIAFPYV